MGKGWILFRFNSKNLTFLFAARYKTHEGVVFLLA